MSLSATTPAMSGPVLIIAGTDTDVGKTVFAAALAGALGAHYWKPVQAGLDAAGEGDSATVARLSGLAAGRIVPEIWRLGTACSPHEAAERDGVAINLADLVLPRVSGPLIVELAGGLMTPLSRSTTIIDLVARWVGSSPCSVILVARTALGTINHSLLSLEALRARAVPVHGVAFVGDSQPETESIIAAMGRVRRLGRLPFLDPLNRDTLAHAFRASFGRADLSRADFAHGGLR